VAAKIIPAQRRVASEKKSKLSQGLISKTPPKEKKRRGKKKQKPGTAIFEERKTPLGKKKKTKSKKKRLGTREKREARFEWSKARFYASGMGQQTIEFVRAASGWTSA